MSKEDMIPNRRRPGNDVDVERQSQDGPAEVAAAAGAGLPEPIRVNMDLDVGTVDAIIDRLARAHPGRRSPAKE